MSSAINQTEIGEVNTLSSVNDAIRELKREKDELAIKIRGINEQLESRLSRETSSRLEAERTKLIEQENVLLQRENELLRWTLQTQKGLMTWKEWINQKLPEKPAVSNSSSARSSSGCKSLDDGLYSPGTVREWESFFADAQKDVESFHSPEPRNAGDFDSVSKYDGSNNGAVRSMFGVILTKFFSYAPFKLCRVAEEAISSTPVIRDTGGDIAVEYTKRRIIPDLKVREEKKTVLVVECKRPDQLSKVQNLDLHSEDSQNDPALREITCKLWEYMVSENIGYGIITSLDSYYFVRRVTDGNGDNYDIMEISLGKVYEAEGLLGAIHYVLREAYRTKENDFDWRPPKKDDGTKDGVPRGMPDSDEHDSSEHDFSEDDSEDYNRKGGPDQARSPPSEGTRSKKPRRTRTVTVLEYRESEDLHLARTPLWASGRSGFVVMGEIEGRRVACKLARAGSSTANALIHEASVYDVLQKWWGQYVPELVECGKTSHGKVVYIGTEFIEGCTMGQLNTITDTVAQSAREALAAIHSSGILHGDLHQNNIMVVNGRSMFIDFGSASAITSIAECEREVKELERMLDLHGQF